MNQTIVFSNFELRQSSQIAQEIFSTIFYHVQRKCVDFCYDFIPSSFASCGAPPWSSGSMLDHRSLPPMFESRRGHIWRLFRLSLRLITFGSHSAHLAYHRHKDGRKTLIIIIIICQLHNIKLITARVNDLDALFLLFKAMPA